VDLAHEVGTKEGEVTLQFLERSFDREYKDYLEANPDFSTDGTDSPGVVRASYLASLSRTLQDFLDAGILRQGVVSRCSRCGSRIWKELSQIRQQHSCDGCGAMVRTKAESQWVYRLNSLVKNAIALHGTVALVCGLAALRQRSRNSFIFSTGIAFYEHFDDKEAAAEADVICVTDGELWVGEIKTDAKDFNSAEIQKLISLATRLGADKAFIFALNGDQKRLKDLCDAASDSNDSAIVIEFLRSAGSPLHSVMAV
jgi:DNA-directed RNA polymerase subunit RPC12/RpoP